MNFCNVLRILEDILDWYSMVGPEYHDGGVDPTYDNLVHTIISFNNTAYKWKTSEGGKEMEVCFLK